MPDSRSVTILREYRLAMNAAEDEIVRLMGKRWLAIERNLESNMAALANEMLLKAQAGEVVTDAMIRRAERYAILHAQMGAEIAKYNREAAGLIRAGQENAMKLGIQAATDAIEVTYPDALSSAFNRINLAAVDAMIGKASDGSPLLQLLVRDFEDAADAIVQALVDGVAQGLGAVETARGMVEGMGVGMDRALLIARTELNGAYRAGSTEQYRQSGVVEGWMRLVARDEACLACLALDGEKFDTADEMDDHPNGRCTCVPIITGMDPPEWEKAQDWFAEQSEAKQEEILGSTRFEMYKNGTPLEAFGQKIHNDVWGDSPSIVGIEDLKAGGAVSGGAPDGGGSPSMVELNDFENRISGQPKETAGIYSPDGKLIFEKDGTARSVKFTNEEIQKMAGNILTHNHPNSSSFSVDDIKMLIYANAKEIRAVGNTITYSMINEGATIEVNRVRSAFNRIFKKQVLAMKEDMALNPYNSTWEIFAQKYGMTYTRIPR